MSGTIFRQSVGIGLGFGLSIVIFFWLTSDLPPETQREVNVTNDYATLDDLAHSWATMERVDNFRSHHTDFDLLPGTNSKIMDDPVWIDSIVGVGESSTSDEGEWQTEPTIQSQKTIKVDDNRLASQVAELLQVPAEPSEITEEEPKEPITAVQELASVGSQQVDPAGSIDLKVKDEKPGFAPIRSPGIHANPFFQVHDSQLPQESEPSPTESTPAHPPIGSDELLDREMGSEELSKSSKSQQSFEDAMTEPFRFAKSSGVDRAEPVLRGALQASTASNSQILAASTDALPESAALRAAHHIEYGKTLARRGAFATAEREFIAALNVLARDFDARAGNNQHSHWLSQGMLALKESTDFAVKDMESQLGLDVAGICESHQSGALSPTRAKQLSSVQALQQYLAYSQFKIEEGAGRNVVAAEALFCLGKLRTIDQETAAKDGNLHAAQAIVFHRAAMSGDPNNYRSAHELGVLLAHLGELNQAKELFKQSLRVQPTAKTWMNLAKLHQRMNEPKLAQLAEIEYQKAIDSQNIGPIRWVDSPQFQANALPEHFPTRVADKQSSPTANATGNQGLREADSRNQTNYGNQKTWVDRLKFW